MIDLPASVPAIKQFERMLTAVANGGSLRCIEQEGGNKIFYVKQAPRSDQDFLSRLLFGKPGPGRSSPVLRLVVDNSTGDGARAHVQARLPALLRNPPARASTPGART